jgi:predicted ATPase/DNA-binding XRE family transcriptional regulator
MAAEAVAFGATLRRHRIAAGLTQEELAERAGLSTRGIQDLERGARRSPHATTIRRLSEALGQLDPDGLAGLEPPLAIGRAASQPIALSSVVGREQDLRAVMAWLRRARLVTLTGPGGIGKTRLSLEVAAALAQDYEDGVWLAELGSLSDGRLVVPCVAAALGIREQFLRPLVDTLSDSLVDRSLLLVLDNCEHVLDDSVALLDRLLRSSPMLRVLATSREPLRVEGEAVWRVPPLRVPDLDQVITHEILIDHGATRLFLDRAQPLVPSLALDSSALRAVAVVCHRLDGVPLAIELAAARTQTFTIEHIAQRLDDALRLLRDGGRTAPARQRTLRAAIDWSYGLLSEAEKLLLERLSIFAAGFSLDAAETVTAGGALAPADVLELLGNLVDKSLVVAQPGTDGTIRYRLQEVLHQFGHERLAERAQVELDALHERHARYFLNLVELAEPRALGDQRRAWLDRLELELDNFRAARHWFVRRADAEAAQRLCACLYRLLVYRGHASEGRASLLEALALDGGSPATRAKALHFLGSLAWTQADYAAAVGYQQEGLKLRRQIGDRTGIAWSLAALGIVATMRNEFDVGKALLEEACLISRPTDDRYVLGLSLSLSALTDYLSGDFDEALAVAHEALEVAHTSGFASVRCMALTTIGCVGYQHGDQVGATHALEEALATAEALGEAFLIVRAALNLAVLASDGGDTVRARSLLAESIGLAQGLGNHHHVAQSLEGVARFAAQRSDAGAAARFTGAAAAIRASIGAPLSPTERILLERWLGRLGAPSGAFDEGRRWSAEQAAARALEFVERA